MITARIGGGAEAEIEPEEEDGLKPLPDRLLTELTAYRTLALREASGNEPGIAYLALLHALCLRLFYRYGAESCLEVEAKSVMFGTQAPGLADTPLAARVDARAPRASGNFIEGLRYVGGRPDLKAILVMLFLVGTFGLNFPIFISTMAVSVFHADARGYGMLSSIMAIGNVAGALLNAGRREAHFGRLLLGSGGFGIGCTLAALTPNHWLFAGTLVIIGVDALILTNRNNSLMQLSTEPAMRGRVMALRVGITLGGTPIVGWLADHCGPRWSLGVGAAAGCAAAIVGAYALARLEP